jgi:hypothetical protein
MLPPVSLLTPHSLSRCVYHLHTPAHTHAQSEEAAEAARAAIEYVELVIEVPQSKVGWIVGAKGANIRDIQEKSEVLSLNVGTQLSAATPLCCHFLAFCFFCLDRIPDSLTLSDSSRLVSALVFRLQIAPTRVVRTRTRTRNTSARRRRPVSRT